MRSGQIQQAIANGVPPFVLCRLVSTKIRTNHHQRGGHIQDSIYSVFQSLPERIDSWNNLSHEIASRSIHRDMRREGNLQS